MNHNSKKLLAPAFMILSAFSFACMGGVIKYAESVSYIEKVFFRNLIIFFLIFIMLIPDIRKGGFRILAGKPQNRMKLLLRSLFGFIGVLFYFYSVEQLVLADSSLLNRLSSILVIIFSAVFLKQKLKRYQYPALIASFAGMILVIKPGFNMQLLPAVAGLLGAVTAAAAYTMIASLRGSENSLVIIFWFSGISIIFLIFPFLRVWTAPTASELAALIATGLFSAAGQFFLTLAYSYGSASEVAIYNYTHVVFSALIAVVFFGEIPDAFSIGGAVLILGSALFLYFRGKKAAK